MQFTPQQREQAFEQASAAIQTAYGSPSSGKILRGVFKKFALPEQVYSQYVQTIGDVILGFYPKSQLATLLQQNAGISPETAVQIAADLTEFLRPIPETGAQNVQPPQSPIAQTPPTPSFVPPATVAPVAGLSGSHTMQEDIDSLQKQRHGESPEMPSVPRYAKPLAETPRYDSSDGQK